MSLFHKLQDVYFDSLQLGDELGKIPSECDCPEEARRSGTCCCGNSAVRADKNRGCLKHLDELRNKIQWAIEDLRRERQQLRDGEMNGEVSSEIFLIENSISHLGSSLDRIKEELSQPHAKCAHEELEQLKQRSTHFQHYAETLNKAL